LVLLVRTGGMTMDVHQRRQLQVHWAAMAAAAMRELRQSESWYGSSSKNDAQRGLAVAAAASALAAAAAAQTMEMVQCRWQRWWLLQWLRREDKRKRGKGS